MKSFASISIHASINGASGTGSVSINTSATATSYSSTNDKQCTFTVDPNNPACNVAAGRACGTFHCDKVSDPQAVTLARDIAKQIEQQLTYPGEIRVTVMRESRFVEYAR